MPILKSDGVVLRRIKYGETSLIATFYTLDYGKISLIAKGARNPKSKFVGSLEPSTHASIVYYNKDSRDLQILSEIEIIRANSSIVKNLRKSAVAMAIVSLINTVIHEKEPNKDIFNLLVESLANLNDQKYDAAILWYFEINLLRELGLEIDVRNPEGLSSSNLLKGEPLKIFDLLKSAVLPELEVDGFTRGTFRKMNKFFNDYFSYHIDGFKKSKALSFVEKLV